MPGLPPQGPSPRLREVRAARVRRGRERPARAPPCSLPSPFPLTQGLPGPKGERGEKVSVPVLGAQALPVHGDNSATLP